MAKVSIIMSEFNTPKEHFDLAVNSILNQSFTEFELIIVDDSVDQHLESYMEDFSDNRIVLIKNGKNYGFVYSLNKAIEKAQTNYLVRMDTDDISSPDRVAILYDEINKYPEYSVIGTSIIEFDDQGKYNEYIYDLEYDFDTIMNRKVPAHATVIYEEIRYSISWIISRLFTGRRFGIMV